MQRNRLTSILSGALLVIAFILGCSKTVMSNSPPNAAGEIEGQKISLIKGSYTWNNTIADAPNPENLVKNSTAYVVKRNAELKIIFQNSKPNEISVELWGDVSNAELQRKEDLFVLPEGPGTYVLSIWGKWAGGDQVNYAAKIQVE